MLKINRTSVEFTETVFHDAVYGSSINWRSKALFMVSK